jgi:hypothetical protein
VVHKREEEPGINEKGTVSPFHQLMGKCAKKVQNPKCCTKLAKNQSNVCYCTEVHAQYHVECQAPGQQEIMAGSSEDGDRAFLLWAT